MQKQNEVSSHHQSLVIVMRIQFAKESNFEFSVDVHSEAIWKQKFKGNEKFRLRPKMLAAQLARPPKKEARKKIQRVIWQFQVKF